MTQLVTCPECNRHLRQTETTCPFCGAGVREAFADIAARRIPGPGLSRAAILAFAAASVGGGACGGETASPGPGAGGAKGAGGFMGTGSVMGNGGVVVGAGGVVVGAGGFAQPYGAPPYGIPPFSGGAPGAGGISAAGGAADAGAPPGFDCIDLFSGGKPTRCCPNPHDCTGKPEGWPGYACAPAHESYCSCACNSGQWLCYC